MLWHGFMTVPPHGSMGRHDEKSVGAFRDARILMLMIIIEAVGDYHTWLLSGKDGHPVNHGKREVVDRCIWMNAKNFHDFVRRHGRETGRSEENLPYTCLVFKTFVSFYYTISRSRHLLEFFQVL